MSLLKASFPGSQCTALLSRRQGTFQRIPTFDHASPLHPHHQKNTDASDCSSQTRRRGVVTFSGKAKAVTAAAAGVSSAAASFLTPESVTGIVMAMVTYHLSVFAAMLFVGKMQWLRSLMRSFWAFLPMALVYGVLLANSWAPDSLSIILPSNVQEGLTGAQQVKYIPQIEGIMHLFQRSPTAASWMIHICAINMFLGRGIYNEGHEKGIPIWHSLILACCVGPLGLIVHLITKAVWKPSRKPVVLKRDDGDITLMPYE